MVQNIFIEPADLNCIDDIIRVFDIAKQFMIDSGNKNQWIDGYPSVEIIKADIAAKRCYVCRNIEGCIVGVFSFFIGNDATYEKISGKWLNNLPYGVIHRMASDRSVHGIAYKCFEWCSEQCDNIRIDTHRDNVVMQTILSNLNFEYCGIIWCHNGTERLAYQRCKSDMLNAIY